MSPCTSSPRSGFTLVELLVASTLGAVAMTALLACFLFLARNFMRMAHAHDLDQQARTALAWIQADVAQAESVKPGTTPTAEAVTLVLPAGEVTYSYDATALRVRRQATFGGNPDMHLLTSPGCRCTAFSLTYYTGSLGAPTDQLAPAQFVPLSIKQLRLAFVLQTPSSQAEAVQMRREVVSAPLPLRQRQPPDGR